MQYLEGYKVNEMWECDFRQCCRQHPHIYQFMDSMRPGFVQHHKGKITENNMLELVVTGQLFGLIKVDIEVPAQ